VAATTRIHARDTAVYIDEFDFNAVLVSAEITIDNDLGEVTAFNDTDATFVEGKAGVTASLAGLWSLTSPSFDPQMFTDIVTPQQVGIYPRGVATDALRGFEFEGVLTEQPRGSTTDSAISLNLTYEGKNNLVRTYVMDKDTSLSASGNTSAIQVGAVSATQEIYGVIRAFSVSGGPGTLDIVIASDDVEGFGGTPETQLTFTQLSAVGEEVKFSGAGAITDDWWRVEYTVAGGGTWSVLVTLGIRTATIA